GPNGGADVLGPPPPRLVGGAADGQAPDADHFEPAEDHLPHFVGRVEPLQDDTPIPSQPPSPPPKESMQPQRRVRPPTARELDPARGDVAFAARSGYDLRPAWVRGRHDTGAPCPSCNLARETVTRSLVTRSASSRCDARSRPVNRRSW